MNALEFLIAPWLRRGEFSHRAGLNYKFKIMGAICAEDRSREEQRVLALISINEINLCERVYPDVKIVNTKGGL